MVLHGNLNHFSFLLIEEASSSHSRFMETIGIALGSVIIIALLTGLAGAGIGAATNHFLTRDREKQTSKQFQHRTVIAIRSELESIIEINNHGILKILKSVGDDKFLETKFEITQDYFAVFNSNASQLGRIDPALTSRLVKCYSSMKAMVDLYRWPCPDLVDRE